MSRSRSSRSQAWGDPSNRILDSENVDEFVAVALHRPASSIALAFTLPTIRNRASRGDSSKHILAGYQEGAMQFRMAFGILMFSACAAAQTVSSTIKGTVQDSSGAVVPGAACKLVSSATNATVTVASGPDGGFQFLDLLPGNYT